MPAGIGYQFAPGADTGGPPDQQQGQRRQGLSPQAAVKLLQLRVPERPAASAIAPQALLQAPGMAGVGSDGLSAIIKALALTKQPSSTPQGSAMPFNAALSSAPSAALSSYQAPPPPRFRPADEPVGSNGSPEIILSPDAQFDRQLLDTPVGGGQTLGSGGGVLGNWRDWITGGIQPNESLF